MQEPMKSRAVRVPEPLWQAALKAADLRGESVSDAVRRALEQYVKRTESAADFNPIGHEIMSAHQDPRRSGEWGRVTGLEMIAGCPHWTVAWPDGTKQAWPVVDHAGYEFR